MVSAAFSCVAGSVPPEGRPDRAGGVPDRAAYGMTGADRRAGHAPVSMCGPGI